MIIPRSMSRKEFMQWLDTDTLTFATKFVPTVPKETVECLSPSNTYRDLEPKWDEVQSRNSCVCEIG